MLISSPRTRSIKTTIPALVFGAGTVAVLVTQRNELIVKPFASIFLLLVIYACAAWTLWKPLRLKVADQVEERNGLLHIRRGQVTVDIPYSAIKAHQYLQIGTQAGAKLIFSEPNALGSEIGFYLNEQFDAATVPNDDPLEHMERQIEKSRQGRAA